MKVLKQMPEWALWLMAHVYTVVYAAVNDPYHALLIFLHYKSFSFEKQIATTLKPSNTLICHWSALQRTEVWIAKQRGYNKFPLVAEQDSALLMDPPLLSHFYNRAPCLTLA